MKLVLAVLLMVTVAQILPSCGSDQDGKVVGYVEDKYTAPESEGRPPQPHIYVAGRDYVVPWDFWRKVRIGDLVKYENGRWTITKPCC